MILALENRERRYHPSQLNHRPLKLIFVRCVVDASMAIIFFVYIYLYNETTNTQISQTSSSRLQIE